MKNNNNFKNALLEIIKNTNSSPQEIYDSIASLEKNEFFFIEKIEASKRVIDIGPKKKFRFNFISDEQKSLKKAIDQYKEIIDELKKSQDVNGTALLLLASCLDDYTHDDPLQEYVYKDLDKNSVESLFKKIVSDLNKVDWKNDLDIQTQPSSIADWDSLFRSFSNLYHTNNVLDILSFSIKKAKSHNIKLNEKLHPLLKARLLYQISFDDYLSVFSDNDFDFIFSLVFSNHFPRYSNNDKAIRIIESELSSYSLNIAKFESLVSKIFTNYYYQALEKDDEKSRIIKVVAEKIAEKIKDDSYLPSLSLKDYIIYPRILQLFSSEKISITDQEVSDHIVKTLIKTLDVDYSFVYHSFEFPYDLLSKETQESYAYIMRSVFYCSDDVFNQLKIAFKKYSYSILPKYFGRFHADKLAVVATTNLFLLLFSTTWLTEDITAFKSRFDILFRILYDSLLEPYSYRLAEHLINYSKVQRANDERTALFFMMEHIKEKNEFKMYDSINEFIENTIPLKWPWQ